MRWIIDASAGIQFAINRKIDDSISGLLIKNVINSPDLYVSETGNGFWKYISHTNMTYQQGLSLYKKCLDLVDHFIPSQVFCEEALYLSSVENITVYDALYLALAQIQECGIISFDKKLLSMAKRLNIKTI